MMGHAATDRPPAAERPSWHLGHLDALRGIAVIGVLLVHCSEACQLPFLWHQVSLNGQRGVQLFFLVSAFTLFLSSDKRRPGEARPTRNFFIRRFFRLTPMYYGATLLTAWLLPGLFGGWRDGLLGLFFAQGVSPEAILHVAPGAWTLTDEAMFYLCLPLLVRSIRSLRDAVLALAFVLPAVLALSFVLARVHPNLYQYFSFLWFPIEFPVFLMGIVVYFLWKERIAPGRLTFRGSPRLASLLFLAASAALFVLNIPETNRKLYPSSAGWACFLIAVLLHPWPAIVNRLTIFLGKISFSIYLLHLFFLVPLQAWAAHTRWFPTHPRQELLFLLATVSALTAATASLTWLSIEEGGIRLGRRLIAHLEHRAQRRREQMLLPPATALLEETNSADAQF